MHAARRIPVLSVVVLLALVCVAVVGAATRPVQVGGTWKGTYSGAVSGKFTVHWRQVGSKLTGSITLSNPKGNYGIGGSVRGSAIKFGAVGVGATYTGTVKGKSMSGTWKSGPGGGSWSANKS